MDFVITTHGNVCKFYAFTANAIQWAKKNLSGNGNSRTYEIDKGDSMKWIGRIEHAGLKVQY
jgi:23S rRNA G2069 N7-methylase RlmK/C1962 C5-methylase RlmI